MSNEIAIIGWGSLIWDPRNLKIKSNTWYNDGPRLPIEFVRKSKNNRITLVIYPPYLLYPEKWVTTYWNFMDVESIKEARENLQNREGCLNLKPIGYFDINSYQSQSFEILNIIKTWVKQKDFSGVIWTDLSPTISLDEVIPHLKSLQGDPYVKAKEYILNTPKQINTPMREKIEKSL